jgi:hypothetical protein
MRFTIFLSLILIGLLAHCAPAPKPSAPVPAAPEPVPPPPEPVPPAPEAVPSLTPTKVARLPSESEPQPYIHEVRWPWETLSHIALWYTGSVSNWEKIAQANPGLKPRRIRVGNRILIPEALLKVRKLMPRDFVHSLAAPRRRPSTRSVQPSKDLSKEELFGPVEVLSPPSASEKNELYGPIELYQAPASP